MVPQKVTQWATKAGELLRKSEARSAEELQTWFMRIFWYGATWSSRKISSRNFTTLRSSFCEIRLHVL